MTNTSKNIVVATGASGGHMFPAISVAVELKKRGYNCVFVGGGKSFKSTISAYGFESIELPASPWNVKNPIKKVKAILNLACAFFKAFSILHKYKACTVFGTGGYATVAAVLSGKISGIPTIIQEQNVMPGRANKFLFKWVDRVCLSFNESRHYLKYRPQTFVVTGNPIREAVEAAAKVEREEDGKFRLLILGGSQGARVLSDVVPAAVDLLHDDKKERLVVIQQCRAEDVDRVKKEYEKMGVESEVSAFFEDAPARVRQSHLVVGRSGASTVNECTLLGRAAVFVPLKLADGHQMQNAQVMAGAGAAIIIDQTQFTAERLAQELIHFMKDSVHLQNMEKASLSIAQYDAAQKVADEVVKQADQDIINLERESAA